MILFPPLMTASSVGHGSTTLVLSSALLLLLLPLCNLAHPACFRKALRTLFVHTERTAVLPFCTLNVMRSVQTSHLLLSSEISSPSSVRVSARSLMGSPRCDFTLIRKVALPARTRCVSRQTISWRMSASGAVAKYLASVAFPPCPTHFLIAHQTAVLSHSNRTSSLRAADCNANTIPPNSGLFELVPSSSLPTRAHLSASPPWILLTPSCHLCTTHLRQQLLIETQSSQLSDFSAHPVVPLKIIHAHRTFTLLVHPRLHVNHLQFGFHDPTLPPPSLHAVASAHVNFSVGCFIFHPSFCFRLPLLFLASISFSTEDSFFNVFKPSWCAVPLHWSHSAPHNPIFSCLNCTFAFLPPLVIQAISQEDSWSLLVSPEPVYSSACIWEEGRSCRLSLQLCRRE